jgi:hypothetical protein
MTRLTSLALCALLALSVTACEDKGSKPTTVKEQNGAVESQDKGSVTTTDEMKKVDDSNTGTNLDSTNTDTQQNTQTQENNTQDNHNETVPQGQ